MSLPGECIIGDRGIRHRLQVDCTRANPCRIIRPLVELQIEGGQIVDVGASAGRRAVSVDRIQDDGAATIELHACMQDFRGLISKFTPANSMLILRVPSSKGALVLSEAEACLENGAPASAGLVHLEEIIVQDQLRAVLGKQPATCSRIVQSE